MNPAQPIKRKSEDNFERFSFAEHLANFLCLDKDAPSIVIGIEGTWGDGKTSCINLVKEVLNSKMPKPIMVDYNPWLISTLDSVIEGFIIELASAIGLQSSSEKGKNAAQKVLQFGKILSPIKLIPGIEPWGSIVESVLNSIGQSTKAVSELANLSIQSRKNDLQKYLKKINRPIVVVIDDVDRLPPDHVRIIFQMLKAICNFDGVSYLIAYDPEPVAKALSYNGVYDGKKYMEKLIQTSYPLPRLPYVCMKDYVQNQILSLAKKYNLEISGHEEELFHVLLNKTDFVRLLETPRDVIRLCNRLNVSAPKTRNEVAFADLVAFELLQLKYPDIARIVRLQRNSFVSVVRVNDEEMASESDFLAYDFAFTEATKEEKKNSLLYELLLLAGNNEEIHKRIKTILLFLFPKIGGKEYHIEQMPHNINRIQNRDAFLKLLHCGVSSFTFSTEEARRFCQNPEERYEILADHRDDFEAWIDFLEHTAKGIKIMGSIGLCDTLIEAVEEPEERRPPFSISRRIGEFLYEIVKKNNIDVAGLDVLNHLVNNTKSLSVSEAFLLSFLGEAGIWGKEKYFSDENMARLKRSRYASDIFTYSELYKAAKLWLDSVRNVANTKGIIETQEDVISIFYCWALLNNNDFSEVNEYVIKRSHNVDWLRKFLKLFNLEQSMDILVQLISREKLSIIIEKSSAIAGDDEQINRVVKSLQKVLKEKGTNEKTKDSE